MVSGIAFPAPSLPLLRLKELYRNAYKKTQGKQKQCLYTWNNIGYISQSVRKALSLWCNNYLSAARQHAVAQYAEQVQPLRKVVALHLKTRRSVGKAAHQHAPRIEKLQFIIPRRRRSVHPNLHPSDIGCGTTRTVYSGRRGSHKPTVTKLRPTRCTVVLVNIGSLKSK